MADDDTKTNRIRSRGATARRRAAKRPRRAARAEAEEPETRELSGAQIEAKRQQLKRKFH